jgi:mRNA degradation ribonuclease J1/J2
MENGAVWEFDGERAKILDLAIPTGRHWIFREFDGAMDDVAIKERRAAARSGVVVVDCLVTKRGQELSQKPKVTLSGFLSTPKKNEEMKKEIEDAASDAFENYRADNPDGLTREQSVAVTAKKIVRKQLDLKPLVIVNFLST